MHKSKQNRKERFVLGKPLENSSAVFKTNLQSYLFGHQCYDGAFYSKSIYTILNIIEFSKGTLS